MNSKNNPEALFNQYQSLFEHHHDACFALNMEGNFTLFNDAAMELTGYALEEAQKLSFMSLISKEECSRVTSEFQRVLQGNRVIIDTSLRTKDGDLADVSITAVPIYSDEKISGVVGMAKETTNEKKLKKLLTGKNKVLEMMATGSSFDSVLDRIITLIEDVSGEGKCSILLLDEKKERLTHGSSCQLPKDYIEKINGLKIGPNVGSCGTASFFKTPIFVSDIATSPLWEDFKDVALENNLKACWSYPIKDNNHEVLGTFAIYYETSKTPTQAAIKMIEEAIHLTSMVIQHYRAIDKINFMAFQDELTLLANRRHFNHALKQAMIHFNAESSSRIGIMYLDLDRFKMINDTLGHHVGDKLLMCVAARIESCIGDNGVAARQGGDEFTILINHVTKCEINRFAEKIINTLEKPFCIGHNEIYVSPSIGVSQYPLDGDNSSELIRKADIAMYHAKKEGRSKFKFYNYKLDVQMQKRLELENELRKALDKNEFKLVYQPIIHLATNEVKGVEALIRWENNRLGKVSPSQFIPVAEESGLILPIGEWVIRTVCQQLQAWNQIGRNIDIAVNISIRQFYQPNFIPMIQSLIEEYGINPSQLIFEITESMTMEEDDAAHLLYRLKELGIKIAIDDFGTGYSSLSYLKSFPFDHLKIDQAFIKDIENNKGDEDIAITILMMAQNLGVEVIAEGVETLEQLQFLMKHNCQKAQGFYFSEPLIMDELGKSFLG